MSHQADPAHARAEGTREMRDYQVSLELCVDSEISYQQAQDLIGLSEVQASKALAYKHLYTETEDPNYLSLARYAALAGVEIAHNSGLQEALAIPLFTLSDIYTLEGRKKEALTGLTQAVELIEQHPPKHQDREAVKANFKVHLLLLQQDLEGEDNAQEIEELVGKIMEDQDESEYTRKVWASGAYLKLAALTQDSSYLKEARKIIESDDRLELRLMQLEKLEAEME